MTYITYNDKMNYQKKSVCRKVIKMRICVFGAASSDIDYKYIKAAEQLCCRLAERGHSLIFGAGGHGLMGAAARGFKTGGAHITGVVPHFFKEMDIEALYGECDELIYTDTMRQRKAVMEDNADAFIVMPGGIGTFEEMFEILTLKQLGRHGKPIALFNICGYYDAMVRMLNYSVKEQFVYESCKELYECISNGDDLIDYIEKSTGTNYSVKDLKNG